MLTNSPHTSFPPAAATTASAFSPLPFFDDVQLSPFFPFPIDEDHPFAAAPLFPSLAAIKMPPTKLRRTAAGEDPEKASETDDPNQDRTESDDLRTQPGTRARHRRLWVRERSRAWWDRVSHPDFPDAEFRRSFRMSRETFDMICGELGAAVAKEDTTLRAAIPVQQRVAVCVWRLATGETLRLVAGRFGLGISTCHKLVLEVSAAINSVLMPKFLRWNADPAAAQAATAAFESISGIPNIVGAMYTTHIPIVAPKTHVAAYFNRRHTERNQRTSYSVAVQGVVGPGGLFNDVSIGLPGSMSDEDVLERSALFREVAGRGFLRERWVVGGAGHPLLDWVLVPYTSQSLTWTEHQFNQRIGEVRRVATAAFGRLKGRWGCLRRRSEVKLEDVPALVGACCVLHNICEMRGEFMGAEEARYELFDDEMLPESGLRSASALEARDRIAHNLLHRGLSGARLL
ncbi:hypothetical protein AXF42_Ash001096 [Apostasia shenzhenica]|uniref:DDE Tnp4 domain-containing protein n=1 Tax=Apostasia shenzhenica TaxID=1088818 RepID=A0A2I0ATX2_9ASPA|nr:hypothetical protein AXF42_Ash001096 [Apostasia shenzhenica]